MERKKIGTSILLMICISLTLIYSYLGYYHSSFYRIELILIPFILGLTGLFTFVITAFKRNYISYRFPIFYFLSSIIFTLIIGQHLIADYKPTLEIHVPENYNGMVYLFPSYHTETSVKISPNGIGYIPHTGAYDFKVFHGNRDITDALNEYGRGQLEFLTALPAQKKSISFTCFEVEKNRAYPSSPWNQKHALCMDRNQFDSLTQIHQIDSSQIYFEIWKVEY
tara:strand:- start:113465 stop:114136 length:672 start_codon:yes stop_codon:yes gene_type:complete